MRVMSFIPRDDYERSPYDSVVEFHHPGGLRFFKHPLYNGLFIPREQMVTIGLDPDKAVQMKRDELKAARERREVERYVFIHERPWRFHALLDALEWARVTDWWPCAGNVWIDCEGPGVNAQLWRLYVFADSKAKQTMDSDDLTFYEELPDIVTAYRGADSFRHAAQGFSWTLSRERAAWFARRFTKHRKPPCVATITVPKARIVAAYCGRGEQEVILIDSKLRETRVEELK